MRLDVLIKHFSLKVMPFWFLLLNPTPTLPLNRGSSGATPFQRRVSGGVFKPNFKKFLNHFPKAQRA